MGVLGGFGRFWGVLGGFGGFCGVLKDFVVVLEVSKKFSKLFRSIYGGFLVFWKAFCWIFWGFVGFAVVLGVLIFLQRVLDNELIGRSRFW